MAGKTARWVRLAACMCGRAASRAMPSSRSCRTHSLGALTGNGLHFSSTARGLFCLCRKCGMAQYSGTGVSSKVLEMNSVISR